MGGIKSQFITYNGTKIVLGCGCCAYGDDPLTERNRRCVGCLSGRKAGFILDKKYRDAKQDEHEREDGQTYEDIERCTV